MQRALDRRQPFDQHGKDGYRDTVLWHTVVGIAAMHNVVLVSDDGRAFADPTRRDEAGAGIGERGARGDRPGRKGGTRPGPRELTNELAEIDEATLGEASEFVQQRSFRTLLEEALEDAVPDVELDMQAVIELNVDVPVEHASIVGLQELGTATPRRAYTLPNGEALVDLDVVAGLAIGVHFRGVERRPGAHGGEFGDELRPRTRSAAAADLAVDGADVERTAGFVVAPGRVGRVVDGRHG